MSLSGFTSNSILQGYQGANETNYPKLLEILLRKFKETDVIKAEVKAFLEAVPQQELEKWYMMRSIYSVEGTSGINYFCAASYKGADKKIKVFTLQMNQNIELAKDFLAIRNSRTNDNDMFNYQDEQIMRLPHEFTTTDLQQIIDYFDIITYQKFMKQF